MKVGIPKEIMIEEGRVAVTPAGVSALVMHGHKVFIEKGAGVNSGIPDREFRSVGAQIVGKASDVWGEAEMIIKVKQPLREELDMIREGQIIFTYLHLAADKELTKKLLSRKVIGIAYETIQLDDKSLPLLAPMSEVAGRLSIQFGAFCLEEKNGGSGILLSGVSGVPPAKVTVIGGGIAGLNACSIAVGMGAQVRILDINNTRLRYIQDIYQGRIITVMSNRANLAQYVTDADLVVGAVLIPGSKAPKLITRDMVKNMRKGSAIVDIAIDQGGCSETSSMTKHNDPIYVKDGIVHYCVANMPGAVPRTSTYALTNVTLEYALEIADKGCEQAFRENTALAKGLNVYHGKITYKNVAEAFKLSYEGVVF